MKNTKTLDLLLKYWSIKFWHTEFRNGYHSTWYLSKQAFLLNPRLLEEVATRIAKKIKNKKFDFIIGPVNFWFILASKVAYILNKPFTHIFVPFENNKYDYKKANLHRDFILNWSKAILIDDRAITWNTINAIEKYCKMVWIDIVWVGLITIDRKCYKYKKEYDIKELFEYPFIKHKSKECPLCKKWDKIVYNDIRE